MKPRLLRRAAAGMIAVVVLAACAGGGDPRVTAAANLSQVLGVDDEVANCIIDEFGEERLDEIDLFDPEADEAPSEVVDDAADAVAACLIDDVVSDDEPTEVVPVDCATVETDGPCDYGDDPDLDEMWDDCVDGDMAACDDLYFAAPTGSRYEQFGNTCGDRGFELTCEGAAVE